MKQIIVLISMIVLGIAISGFVMGFRDAAEGISSEVAGEITLQNISTPADFE